MLNRKKIEIYFELCLWKFRLFTLIPVLFGLLSTLNFFVIGSLEIIDGIFYSFEADYREDGAFINVITQVVGGIDHYLIGIVLLIFSFGIYELFVSAIDVRFHFQEVKILQIENLDQLKHKLLQVIIMVMVISFFKKALSMEITNSTDLLFFALAVLFIALSSYLLHLQSQIKTTLVSSKSSEESESR
ncbi:MAG: hypothetical protein BRC33_10105 [Cyanobacteria bacterium SW_9_44_58]|nr:MAG: hypothetical protein BRC33_10105 [Cyanobacteria bacterium SW_9_44_58]